MNDRRPKRYVPVVGPRLAKLLAVVFGLFAVLAVNSAYLVSITVAGPRFQSYFYQWMFLLHLILGLLIVLPVILFGIFHIKNAKNRPNRRAIRVGYALFTIALLLLGSGLILTRVDVGGISLNIEDATARSVGYWVHVISPLIAVWLFILHRLAGRRIKWRVGVSWAAVAAAFVGVMLLMQLQDPRAWSRVGPESGGEYFEPSLARTSSGDFIPARVLDNNEYCLQCHQDIHERWSHSVHRFSSFNNPPYLFSVQETRQALLARDGSVHASRFCAGCHDPVPFFSGAFDDPRFDDPDLDLAAEPTAASGITCTVCHSITHINSPRGNADYTIDQPLHYPFTDSENPVLQWINRQLVKAKPEFHKATFLKPLHKSPEFCGTCHKVHLPEELNQYKWLRGQNHYDSYLLSGVSGHGVSSFYYPPRSESNCNGCHMPLLASADFGARRHEDAPPELQGVRVVHDHLFPSANTAIPTMVDMPDPEMAIAAHQAFLEGVVRVDIFGVRQAGRIDGALAAPLRPEVPALERGADYLLETVIRTVKLGHLLTEGTADSNELWLDVTVRDQRRVIGRSGGRDPETGAVDPWSHFVNAFILDRNGDRIDRRNAEDIFTPLYNNQIPPGAADSVHFGLRVPDDAVGPLTVTVALQYRKFDTTYLRYVQGEDFTGNTLPITTLATDTVVFPIAGGDEAGMEQQGSSIPTWQRWNDYGIGLLRKGGQGELRGAEQAFEVVEAMGRPEGPLNLARVYLREGRVAEVAPAALRRAATMDPAADQWTVLWLTGLVNKQNGRLDEAIDNFRQILDGGFAQAVGRGFDFTKDYRLLNELASTLYLRSKRERGPERGQSRDRFLDEARRRYEQTLAIDPENLAAHYGLQLVHTDLGNDWQAADHAAQHARYKPDDNARDQAIAQARIKYPPANRAAEAVVIYDLHRPESLQLPPSDRISHHDPPLSTNDPAAPGE